MSKILLLANNDVGLYKFRKELIEELLKDNEVFISLPHGDFIPKLVELGCKFIDTSLSRRGTNPIKDLILLTTYIKIIKKVQPKIVLTFTIKPNIYGGIACTLLKVPYICNITGLGSAVERKGVLQWLTIFMYIIALNKAKCIFFQNNENMEYFKKNIKPGRARLIPGSGVNLDEYQLMEYPNDEIIHFLFIARIMKEKGIEQYFDAAKYFTTNKKMNLRFHILGYCEDDYDLKLRELHEKEIIIYHGMQSDVRKFLEFSHCTVHPSYYPEGMSNVLLESAACGRPIITSNRSGCREVVDDGINGYLVNREDSVDLINKIDKFLSLDYEMKKEMGLSGRKKVENEFDRRIVINAYLREIEMDD